MRKHTENGWYSNSNMCFDLNMWPIATWWAIGHQGTPKSLRPGEAYIGLRPGKWDFPLKSGWDEV